MKRWVACLILLIATTTYAQDTPNTIAIGERVNVRSGPGIEYTVRGGAGSSGGVLTVTGKTDFDASRVCTGIWERDKVLWLRVDLEGIEGWVNFCAGDFEGNIDSLPVVDPMYPVLQIRDRRRRFVDQLGTAPDSPYVLARVRVVSIQLRESPSLSAEVIDNATLYSEIYVTGRSSDGIWVRVEYSNKIQACYIDPCTGHPISGWMPKFLLNYPVDWEDSVPIVDG